MPMMVEPLVLRPNAEAGGYMVDGDETKIMPLVRQAVELGADIVKTPLSAIRLKNGNTLIADNGNDRVIELNVNKEIVWEKDGFGHVAKAYREE